MATVSLRHVTKVYPEIEDEGKKKKHRKAKDEAPEEKKSTLRKTEDGVVAVDDFNLEIADGEFVVLVGPSGCGKSTTLRMIAGLESITDGELYIDGKLMNEVAPKDRDIAMVFQNYALYPHMTVRQNMEFPLRIRKLPQDQIDAKVNDAARVLGITQYLDRKPKALSGGQRQRVAIGRAIVRDPKVLLMDEPLSNLDAKLRNQMRAEIIKLRQKIEATFIYVTHDQTEAMTLGDRIVVMKDGMVQQVGTPQEVFDAPANLFVAGFIGVPQMNFYDAKLVRDGKGTYAAEIDGVRPEHIQLTGDPASMIHGKVEITELMGSTMHLHITASGKPGVIIVPTMELGSARYQMGSDIAFTFSGSVIHLFDRTTGKNLEY